MVNLQHARIQLVVILTTLLFESSWACSEKFYPRAACDTLNMKLDSELLIFTIEFTRPPMNQENLPENIENKRKWSDSLFLNYHIFGRPDTSVRLPPPSDSQIEWAYSFLFMAKSTATTLVEEPFIRRLTYEPELPHTKILKQRMGVHGETYYRAIDVLGKSLPDQRLEREIFKIRVPVAR